MVYIELTREKIFPLAVIVSLIITAAGAFILFDSFTQFTDKTGSVIVRERSDFTYWLLYQAFGNSLSVYATHATTTAKSVPVLLYHGESERTGNTPLRVFVDQMRALKQDGWQTITLDQFRDFIKNGTPVPDKSFLLTFDDGRRDTFYPADPVLKDLGFNAVMYVITGLSLPQNSRPPAFYLNKSELHYMSQTGRWELQSHGDQDHLHYRVQSTTDLTQEAKTVDGYFMSNKLWNDAAARFETDAEFGDRIRHDMRTARDILEKEFGKPVYSFAFPFNDYGQESVNFPGALPIVTQITPSVYTFAMYQHYPGNGDSFNYPDPTAVMIRRIEPPNDMSGAELVARLKDGRAKPLPYKADNFGNDWLKTWGSVRGGEMLELSASKDTVGASIFLDGTWLWRDYYYEIMANKVGGHSVSLIGRNKNDVRYVACTFGNDGLVIEQTRNGQQTELKKVPLAYEGGPARLGLAVQGSTISCYFNGAELASAQFTDMQSGGIGLEVWDGKPGVAHSEFTSVAVHAL